MPTGRITKQAVDQLQPGPKEYFYWDEEFTDLACG